MPTKQKTSDARSESAPEVIKTPIGITLPIVDGVAKITGPVVVKCQEVFKSTVAQFASYLGVTPFRYTDIKRASEGNKKEKDQVSVHIILRLLITRYPELYPHEHPPTPTEVFQRLQKRMAITEESFAIMLGLSATESRRLFAPGFSRALEVAIVGGNKWPLGPSAIRLLRILNELMDLMDEHPRKYRGALDTYRQVVDEVAQDRGMKPGAIWKGGSWERGPGPGDPIKLSARGDEVKKQVKQPMT